jgi:hypothetical protein
MSTEACSRSASSNAVVPLEDATAAEKKSQGMRRDRLNGLGWHGWEVVMLTPKRGDLVAWPVVLLKRRKPRP